MTNQDHKSNNDVKMKETKKPEGKKIEARDLKPKAPVKKSKIVRVQDIKSLKKGK